MISPARVSASRPPRFLFHTSPTTSPSRVAGRGAGRTAFSSASASATGFNTSSVYMDASQMVSAANDNISTASAATLSSFWARIFTPDRASSQTGTSAGRTAGMMRSSSGELTCGRPRGEATVEKVTCIRNADWVIAWDAAARRHVYRRDIDVAFSDDRLLFIGPRFAGRVDEAV